MLLILFAVAWGMAIVCGFMFPIMNSVAVPNYILYIIAFFSCPLVGFAIIILSIRAFYIYSVFFSPVYYYMQQQQQ